MFRCTPIGVELSHAPILRRVARRFEDLRKLPTSCCRLFNSIPSMQLSPSASARSSLVIDDMTLRNSKGGRSTKDAFDVKHLTEAAESGFGSPNGCQLVLGAVTLTQGFRAPATPTKAYFHATPAGCLRKFVRNAFHLNVATSPLPRKPTDAESDLEQRHCG